MKRIVNWAPRTLVLAALCALIACGGDRPTGQAPVPAEVAQIEGSVVYRERMLLPPGIEVVIQLEDVSRADAMATVLATVKLTPQGGPPYDFAIEYDPAKIDSRMRYGLRASISNGGRLLFTTTDYIDPFQGNPVDVLVRRVPESVTSEGPALEGGTWVLQTLAGEPAGTGAGGRSIDIQFDAEQQRFAGFSGCNRYTGGYVREGASELGSPLKFGPTAGTMMACADGAELERSYLQILGRVTAFRLEGDTLSLLAGPEVVATFGSA